MPEATELVGELTRGVMADSALLTVGLVEGPMINEALDIIRKGGAVVLTALASVTDVTPTLPMLWLTVFQKRLLGSLYGEANPRADIPRLLSLYREGKLLLDEAVTTRVQTQRHQRGLRRHARGPQHPRRRHPRPLTRRTWRLLDTAHRYQSRSMIVTLAVPPPSHIVCRP